MRDPYSALNHDSLVRAFKDYRFPTSRPRLPEDDVKPPDRTAPTGIPEDMCQRGCGRKRNAKAGNGGLRRVCSACSTAYKRGKARGTYAARAAT